MLDYLIKNYPGMAAEFYGIEDSESNNELLERIAVKRGCLKSGAEYDLDKAARYLVDDFRNGRIGKISLEIPQ